jgi:PKD repeat protein
MTDTLVVLDGFNSNSYLYEEKQFSVDEDGDYYFGWHTHQGSSGRYWIYIDDVSIYENENSPSASFSYDILDKEVAFFSDSENITEFNWDFGDGATSSEENPFHTYQENGTYTVNLTASNGCGQVSASEDITIDCPISGEFSFTIDKNVVQFTSTSSGTGFLWDFDDGNYSSEENPIHTYSEIGAYNVVFYPMNVCGYDSIAQEVEITEIGVNDINKQQVFIYPNPAKEKIMINTPGKVPANISLFNAQGILVKQKQSKSQTQLKQLSLKGIAEGVYFVVIRLEGKVFHKKITKL